MYQLEKTEENSTTATKTINEDEAFSVPDIENETPQLHQNQVCAAFVRTLVIDIDALYTQVGKDNSIEPAEGNQTLQEVLLADSEASYDVRRHAAQSHSFPALEKVKDTFPEDMNDESDESGNEQRRSAPRKSKRRVKHQGKKKSSDAAMTERTVHQSLAGPASLSASDRQFFRMSDDIMIQLQSVRDEGQWKTFDEVAAMMLHKYRKSREAEIVILIERGQAACYNNRLTESKKLLKQAKNMACGTTNAVFLIGRVYYYLSAVYRRQKKTGKAIECVDIACQNLQHTDLVLDTAMLTYEKASARMDFILQCVEPKSNCLDIVMSDLRKAIDQILALKEDSSRQRYLKTHRYAFIKMAMLLLDCRSATGRQRTVSEANIKEAQKYLDVIEERYWHETKRGEKVQFFLAQSDLHYRMKLFEKAEEKALKAQIMAEEFGFNTEIQVVNDRLQDIRRSRALIVTRNDGFHCNKKHDDCLGDSHCNSAGSHGNNVLMDCWNHSNTASKSNASNIQSPIACADGNHDNTIINSSVDPKSDPGNTLFNICTDDSDSKTEPGSSDGHVGDVSATSDSDWLDSPSYA